jgi:hypothetical protein
MQHQTNQCYRFIGHVRRAVSHDKITRFLSGQDFDYRKLWLDIKPLIRQYGSEKACLVFDDTIIEKQYEVILTFID